MRQMTAIELQEFFKTNVSPVLIDVREEIELKHGVLENALHIPMQQVPQQLNELDKHKDDTVVLVCRSGKRSGQIGQFLEQMGFTDVINLDGGMNAWAADIDINMTVY